jgi:hypothetical protein
MNKFELKKTLEAEGIIQSAYTLDGRLPGDKYVLSDEGHGKWAIYYSERGLRVGEKIFSSENEACIYFLKKLQKDPTVHSC